jgi:heme exporter protein B
MSVLGGALLIARKELRIELRTGEVVVTTGLFALLVVVMASLSFYIDPEQARRLAPGVLWIAVTFAGVLAMGRSWARERDNDAIRGLLLAPVPRSAIFLGKGVATFLLMLVIEALILPVVGILFHLDLLPVIGQVAGLLFLGTLGFTAAGTLFASMSVRSRARDLVLSIVLFPLVSPALIAGVVGTREVLGGAPLADFLDFVRILTAFDLVFMVGGVVLFDTLMSD